ncbi:glycosyltransferase 87 family protein [Streptomyces pathocidini]|uniref:Glycosyltransferase 87 family protein n=1 Tax=Streptomyces pathocidini TaxID=1650571 RepID=A0ABW7UUV1_9ACTN
MDGAAGTAAAYRGAAEELRRLALPVAAWAATRAVLLLCVFTVPDLPGPDVTSDVTVIYQRWFETLRTGAFPLDDVTWQYPPAAALPILSPALLPFLDYASAFFLLACAADAVAFALLLRAGRSGAGGSGADGADGANSPSGPGRWSAGAWVWVAGVPLLGPTAYARYDLMVTAVAVAALLALRRHPRTAGALAAFGALLKVWPVLLLLGTARGRATRACWTAAAATAAAITLLFTAAMPGALSFLTSQRDRGTEVESLGALVFHVARHFGWEGRTHFRYGSVEFAGPYVPVVSTAALVLSVLALAWLALWRVRAVDLGPNAAGDAAFAAVLLFTTTSRVISPQYLLWLVGLAAVSVTLRGARQALPAGLVLAAAAVTLLEFPVFFAKVVASDPLGIALLALRNGLLAGAALVSCRRLWHDTVTVPRRAGQVTEPARAVPPTPAPHKPATAP